VWLVVQDDNLYKFAGWTGTDPVSGKVVKADGISFEGVAESDMLVVAKYDQINYGLDPMMGVPQVCDHDNGVVVVVMVSCQVSSSCM
jgi:hypothetical protein